MPMNNPYVDGCPVCKAKAEPTPFPDEPHVRMRLVEGFYKQKSGTVIICESCGSLFFALDEYRYPELTAEELLGKEHQIMERVESDHALRRIRADIAAVIDHIRSFNDRRENEAVAPADRQPEQESPK